MRNEIWQLYFQALYPVWGIVGVLVALNYGRASRQNWILAGGSWRKAGCEWLAIGRYVVLGCARDIWEIVTLRPVKQLAPPTLRYSLGHLLQLFIAMSFVAAAQLGLSLADIDRTSWELTQLVPTAVAVSLSTLAGLGHLFLAWRLRPRRWRWVTLLLLMSVPFSIGIRYVL